MSSRFEYVHWGTRLLPTERIAHKLRGAAAAIKIDSFPFERPPRHDSFMRWLDSAASEIRRQQSSRMVDCEDLDELGTPAVDDPVWRSQDFADRRIVAFRDDAPDVWEWQNANGGLVEFSCDLTGIGG
jgi:hypothetical protein